MENISDLKIGRAGEYLVCADLILNGFDGFLSDQGVPFDVVMVYKNKLLKIQVKSTRGLRQVPQRKTTTPAFIFHIGHNGKKNRRTTYLEKDVDIFALVDLESKMIAYLPYFNTKTTMSFRIPKYRGQYHNETTQEKRNIVYNLKEKLKSVKEIHEITGINKSTIYRYIENEKENVSKADLGIYFDELGLDKCLKEMNI